MNTLKPLWNSAHILIVFFENFQLIDWGDNPNHAQAVLVTGHRPIIHVLDGHIASLNLNSYRHFFYDCINIRNYVVYLLFEFTVGAVWISFLEPQKFLFFALWWASVSQCHTGMSRAIYGQNGGRELALFSRQPLSSSLYKKTEPLFFLLSIHSNFRDDWIMPLAFTKALVFVLSIPRCAMSRNPHAKAPFIRDLWTSAFRSFRRSSYPCGSRVSLSFYRVMQFGNRLLPNWRTMPVSKRQLYQTFKDSWDCSYFCKPAAKPRQQRALFTSSRPKQYGGIFFHTQMERSNNSASPSIDSNPQP